MLIASFASQGSKEAREQQERLLQAVEERRALRETSVPTSDAEVRAALRAIREPVTLFGEQQVTFFSFSLGQASAAVLLPAGLSISHTCQDQTI